MEQHKTFIMKARKVKTVWVFRYNLDGSLYSYTISKGTFSVEQARWLFLQGRFPFDLDTMKNFMSAFRKNFEIQEVNPKMDFEYFWTTYDKKILKKQAREFWDKRMKEADRILAIMGIRKYKEYCASKKQDLQDPIRYLRNRRYEDEY